MSENVVVSPNADLVQSVTQIDRAIKLRRDNDVSLINWWLYVLLVSWVTFGIYAIVLFFKRIHRIDRFSQRKRAYYDGVLEWTERQAIQRGQGAVVHNDIADMRSEVDRAYQKDLRPINAGLSFLLSIITLGIYGFYVLYRMNRYWWDAQTVEQDLDDKLSQTWIKLGFTRYPITFQLDQSKRRSYGLYLVLSIVTLGIWGLVWDYKIHTDPDNLFKEFHGVEDTVLQIVRSL
jgi:hypothetical protein